MELILFSTFVFLSLILIGLGFYRLEHTELALVGFLFLFLLSMVVITDNLTYKTGETVTVSNTYANISGEIRLSSYNETLTYNHTPYADSSGFFTTHRFGYLLAVLSVIGMIGAFVSIRPERFFK